MNTSTTAATRQKTPKTDPAGNGTYDSVSAKQGRHRSRGRASPNLKKGLFRGCGRVPHAEKTRASTRRAASRSTEAGKNRATCTVWPPLRLVEEVRHEHPPHPAEDGSPLLERQGRQRRLVAPAELDVVYRVGHLRQKKGKAGGEKTGRGGRREAGGFTWTPETFGQWAGTTKPRSDNKKRTKTGLTQRGGAGGWGWRVATTPPRSPD